MNYDFPVITDIEQVKSAIEGYDEFRIVQKEGYYVANYSVAFENTFDIDLENPDQNEIIRRECRGLIFDLDGNLISRPYHKFFNMFERFETQPENIDLNKYHVILEKLDGSMIRPIPTEYGFRLATKAGITDVAMNAEVFIADKPEYSNFILNCIKFNLTPIFEWCSRKNRIVVDYPNDQLILTAIRSNRTGLYTKYSLMYQLCNNFKIPVIKKFNYGKDFNQFLNEVKSWQNDEGVVVRFDNGHMFKIKADEYVLRHRSKDAIGLEKNVIEVLINDSVDDLIPLLSDEDANRLKEFQINFWNGIKESAKELTEICKSGMIMYPDKKEFAINFANSKVLSIHSPFMFGIRDGKDPEKMILDKISKSINTQKKIDENRWLWGGLKWNHN